MVKFKRMFPDAILPRYQKEGDSGMDLHARLEHQYRLYPGERKLFMTGLKIELEPGTEGQVRSRSGLAYKAGIAVLNSPGTIDAGFRGELGALIINHGERPIDINPGDRIAQLVISPVLREEIHEVVEVTLTERGEGGFGHTGV